ncbi:MAG: NUDIX hydrolase [Gammaproteobacteria bacterium]|nr:NUDIX hydrolase [Gammaproteobacteria bacterium]
MTKIDSNIHLIPPQKINSKKYAFYGAECVILTRDNKILLQLRGENWQRFPGYLTNFGGQIETNETPLEALIRELHEELGAKPNPSEIIFLGAVTEAITKHSELIYVYFWYDKTGTITGCYEGTVKYFANVQEILAEPKVMDSTKWALKKCSQIAIL